MWRGDSCEQAVAVQRSAPQRCCTSATSTWQVAQPAFPDQHRFIAYAAHAMRGLIVDYIRERRALKRGGEFHLTALSTQVAESIAEVDDTVRLGDALDRLVETDPPTRRTGRAQIFLRLFVC